MSHDCPTEYPEGFYNLYVSLVLSIFYYACRNLKELRHLVSKINVIKALIVGRITLNVPINRPDICVFPEELIEIMSRDCPTEYPEGFYNLYVSLVLSIFYYACRNLKELQHLVSKINVMKSLNSGKNTF